jgi:hypothetical protein
VTAVAWVGEGAQASKAHSEVTAVAELNSAEVEEAAAIPVSLHPYDLASHSESTTSDHDQKNVDVADVTALKAFAVVAVDADSADVLEDVVSSYFGSVLDEVDSEAAPSGVDSNPDLLGEDLAVEPVAAAALDCFYGVAWHHRKRMGLLKDWVRGDHKHPFEPVALPVHGCWQPFAAAAFAETKPDSGFRANLVGWGSSLAWMKSYVYHGEKMIAHLDQTALPD